MADPARVLHDVIVAQDDWQWFATCPCGHEGERTRHPEAAQADARAHRQVVANALADQMAAVLAALARADKEATTGAAKEVAWWLGVTAPEDGTQA
ncbi:MAG TPA: hypothetical protein VGW74_10540 [Propionibacteriaceae bacterium]|nr:hypothetical protein [Propionibacteriaceae bacterium]